MLLRIETAGHIRTFNIVIVEVHKHLVAIAGVEQHTSTVSGSHRHGDTYPRRSHILQLILPFLGNFINSGIGILLLKLGLTQGLVSVNNLLIDLLHLLFPGSLVLLHRLNR